MIKLEKQLLYSFILALIAVIGFASMAILISDHRIAAFDHAVTAGVQSLTVPWFTQVMKGFTFIGSTPVVSIISIIILLFMTFVIKYRVEALLFFTVVAGTAILNSVLKNIFHRERPTIKHLVDVTGYSFPSGHSMGAFALYGILAFLLWRHAATRLKRTVLIVVSLIMILAIGMSRIYLGVHFPSDVIGAYFVSGFWLLITIWVFQRYKEKQDQQKTNRS